MTTPTIETDDPDDVDVPGARTPNLNADVRHRLRVPGPGSNAPRPPLIGSVASSSSRFASGLARSVPSRHQLRGPQNVAVASTGDNASAPPRWWSPDLVPPSEPAGTAAPLTPRGLPRAVQSVPSEDNRTPGGILGSMVSTAVPVRRMDAVTAAGPMLTSHDRQKLSAVAVNRSMAQTAAASAPATPRPPAMPATPALPPTPRPVTSQATSQATPPAPASPAPTSPAPPAATTPASSTTAEPSPPSPPSPPSATAESSSGPTASSASEASAARPSFLPERRSRLAAVRGAPWGGFAGSLGGGLGGGGTAGGASAGGAGASFPRSVGALALAGADPLSSAVETPAHVRPLPRMVGGGHTVAASANAGRAPVAAGEPLLFGAGRAAGEQSSAASPEAAPSRRTSRAGLAAVAASPTAAPAAAPPAAAPPAAAMPAAAAASAAPAPSITSLPATPESGEAPDGPATDSTPAAPAAAAAGVAPGGGRGRRRASSEAVGIGLATTRSLHPANRAGGEVRPSLNTGALSALGGGAAAGAAIGSALGAATGGATGWLPGAEQRAAGARTSRPGALSLPGRAAAGMGMSDLLPSSRGLAASGESVAGNPLATAFGAADLIKPAGSAATASPAPPTGAATAPTEAPGAPDAPDTDSGSPLQAAKERARGRFGAAAAAAGGAAAGAVAGAATGAAMGPANGVLAPLKRLVDTSAGTSLASHMPAPPPVSIRSSAGDPVPPMSAAAGLAGGRDGGLKRSLIDVTAGMFDSLPGPTPSPADSAGAPPIPASAQFDIGGSTMAEVERRLQVVRDGDSPVAAPSPLDDPGAMENLVDEVVQRIEARVIDELERRGRRHNPGVF